MAGSDAETGSAFGWEVNLDLYDCHPAKVRSRETIINFIVELCDEVLEMKRFGEPWAERFGLDRAETAGYSVVQMIETSSVVGISLSSTIPCISISSPANRMTTKPSVRSASAILKRSAWWSISSNAGRSNDKRGQSLM